jgi:N6-L-threonylcarbamoyladenine synthase
MGHLLSIFCELPEGQSRLLEIKPEADASAPVWSEETGESKRQERAGRSASKFDYPFLGLVISGGHSSLIRVDAPNRMSSLGGTLDDAPGEAYDKVAKCLGLGYPGGPIVDRLAAEGNPDAFDLPRPILHSKDHNFSFSGLKTAVVRVIEDNGGVVKFSASAEAVRDLCASFQNAVIDVLLTKSARALKSEKLGRLAVVGGVACNRGLRQEAARRLAGCHLVFPPPILCTDNAAMIGAAAAHLPALGADEALRLDARPGWTLDGEA